MAGVAATAGLGVFLIVGCETPGNKSPMNEPTSVSPVETPRVAQPGATVSQAAHPPLTRVEGEAKLRIPHENYSGEIASGWWTGTPNAGGSCTYETYLDREVGEELDESGTSKAPEVVKFRIHPIGGSVKLSGNCVWTKDQ